ncbi:uncharacterized protein [Typha latifolia]|uniref:uncharacterized protein n=1 Tax=Typha latifolia TaxID=4733 RepID=UPI003C2DF829
MSEKLSGRGVISMPSEVNKPRGGERRSSTGSTTAKDSVSYTSSDEKKLPIYLRASANSCHDLCKYGRRHAVEEKGKHPIRHRLGNNRLFDNDHDHHHQPKVLNHGERSKRPVIKLKSPSLQKNEISSNPNGTKKNGSLPADGSDLVEESVSVELQTSSPTWKDIVPYEVAVRPTSPQIEQHPVNNMNSYDGKKRQVIRLKAPHHPETSKEKPKVEQMDVSSNNKMLAYEGGKEKMESPVNKAISSVKPKSARRILMEKPIVSVKSKVVKKASKDKPSTSTKNQIIKKMTSASRKYVDLPAKPVIALKKTALKGKPSSPRTLSGSTNVRRSRENKIEISVKSDTMAKIGGERAIKPSRSLLTESSVDGPLALKKSGNTHDGDYNEEKTLYVIEPETHYLEQQSHDYHSSQPSSSDEESESAFSESSELLSEDEGAESFAKDEPSIGENSRPRRSSTFQPEDETLTTHELKFKRGKVIELPSHSDGPWKLRFRRGRVIGERHSDGQLRRRSFRRRSGSAATSSPNLDGQIVVLRHQDAEEKKDMQGLFNNVIEQTASKLVETRKSKVKALVGAFETVISLQDGKPALKS